MTSVWLQYDFSMRSTWTFTDSDLGSPIRDVRCKGKAIKKVPKEPLDTYRSIYRTYRTFSITLAGSLHTGQWVASRKADTNTSHIILCFYLTNIRIKADIAMHPEILFIISPTNLLRIIGKESIAPQNLPFNRKTLEEEIFFVKLQSINCFVYHYDVN